MTKKIYRRFLFAVIMLLMMVSLIATSPGQQAAVRDGCYEYNQCIANCEAYYDYCVATGGTDCLRRKFQCQTDYCYPEACPAP
jgi:hypothetical protein